MHRPMMKMMAALAGLSAASPSLSHEPAKPGTVAAAVATLDAGATVDAFHAALRGGDRAAALDLLADDVLVFESGGSERGKSEYAAEHLDADMAFSKAVGAWVVRRSGGSEGTSAWIASEGRTIGTWNGKPVDQLTTETMVLRRSGEGWRIVHIHWSSARRSERATAN
jgi:ketosteroid isomerase-like protein